jgi:ATP-dependent RNA helicase DHX36
MSGRGGRGRGGGHDGGGGGGRGRGRLAPGLRPVDEGTRLDIAAALAAFQAGPDAQIVFPPGLSNHDRAVVHAECKRYGFTSKSHGKGEARRVTVARRPQRRRDAKDVFDLPLGKASLAALGAHFGAHPPTAGELAAAAAGGEPADAAPTGGEGDSDDEGGGGAGGGGKARRRGGGGAHAAAFTPAEVATRRAKWEARQAAPDLAPLRAGRAALPISAHRAEILAAVATHQVILIAGETGCGKTTQVPQYLLEDAWAAGRGARVICTQPRRISAVSVAERVAAERGEAPGDAVGYTIRLESRGGPGSSLLFCTNGVLLRMLTGDDPNLDKVTHLVIDEIHERDRFADFLLILVRDLLPARPALRVVLMSATLHVELFSGYFAACPVVRVPGFTHPVTDFYLEDVLRATGYEAGAVAELGAGLGGGRPAELLRGGAAGRSGAEALPGAERAAVEAAIEAAFKVGGDAEFDALLEATGAAGAADADGGAAAAAVNAAHPATGATPLVAAAFRGRADVAAALLANGADPTVRARSGATARDCAAQCGHAEVVELLDDFAAQAAAADELASSALALSHYQANTDADDVDLGLLEALLCYICGAGPFAPAAAAAAKAKANGGGAGAAAAAADPAVPLGAVLIFLPGWDEIVRLKERLERSPALAALAGSLLLLPLHSLVAPAEQRRVFVRPPPGVRKVVLATNIAETAVTIDDVVCVVDSGRLKEKSYDAYTGVSTLQSAWVSRASARQRRGRAGRCQPGVAFHMYSRARAEALAEFQLPEIRRAPLDEMALQVKLLDVPGTREVRVAEFLARAVEPPLPQAVERALELLEDIGALARDAAGGGERLTGLGRHLAALPLPPALGKLLLHGALFKVLDPVLTVACCMAYRDPWVLPAAPEARREATLARGALAREAGGASDHLAAAAAFAAWKAARARGNDRAFAARNFVSPSTMAMLEGMRSQLLAELVARGFVASLEAASTAAHRADLVRAVLAAGLYPLVGRLLPIPRGDAKARPSLVTRRDDRARVHPASVCAKLRIEAPEEEDETPRRASLVVFDEITRGDSFLYVKSATAIHPHPALLAAAHVAAAADPAAAPDEEEEEEEEGDGVRAAGDGVGSMRLGEPAEPATALLVVDGWLRFRVPFAAVGQLAVLRLRLAAAFAEAVRRPRRPLPAPLAGALGAAAELFVAESESSDGHETQLGTSFGLGGGRGRGGGGHVFAYAHEGRGAGYGGGGRGGGGGGDRRPGDWDCRCGFVNYASRCSCNRCGAAPGAPGAGGRGGRGGYGGGGGGRGRGGGGGGGGYAGGGPDAKRGRWEEEGARRSSGRGGGGGYRGGRGGRG